MSKKKSVLVFLMIVLMSTTLTSISFSDNFPKSSGSTPMEGVVVDGTITESEWAGLDWKVPFYLDIDDVGNPPDTDGYNYLYLGEDLSNLYIGLDLCSDKTGGTNGEWVSVWLNTNNRTFSDAYDWQSYYNDGVESLVYDVERDQEWDFLSNNIGGFQSTINDDSEYAAVYGTIEGNKTCLDHLDNLVFNVTSEFVAGSYMSRVEFIVDLREMFGDFFDPIFVDHIQWIQFQIYTKANTTISDHYLYLAYDDGTVNPSDKDQVRQLSTTTTREVLQFTYGPGNISVNHEMKFVLYANHTSPFTTLINSLHITPYSNMTNSVATVTYPYTSINNYDIEWSFGPSANNASSHRMYEIRIPKSELEHYDPNEALGIQVGGYGTMAFPGSNYWVFSTTPVNLIPALSFRYLFYDMGGCQTPPSPAIPGYNLYILLGLIGFTLTILIRRKNRNLN
ncbi:MAG: hypothetical protein EAX91_08320 [Candidatus Lokiarchaeota archaeon]|nr:hypothetical protein [Candidatus Lokiarchaeota archaeon]